MPVFVDLAALDHDRIYVNGGRRGLLLSMEPEALIEACGAELIDASNVK